MDRRSFITLLRSPGYGRVERPVQFECCWSVTVTLELATKTSGQRSTGDANNLARREIAQDGFRGRQLTQGVNSSAGYDLASEIYQISSKGISDTLGSSACNGPSNRMGHRAQDQSETCGRESIEGDE